MAAAYILIELSGGKAKDALKKIAGIKGIQCVSAVTGPFDAIAYAEAGDLNKLGDMVVSKVRAINGVSKTITCLVVEI
ncbi:MAG: Lrp/AsnC ligand binding domain-containing protein [bacterium]|nr:Lrp/AsnC ligand binding domain-containing protein [bacterium]